MKIIQAMRDAKVRARGTPREGETELREREKERWESRLALQEREEWISEEGEGEDYSWNDREEDRVIGVAGMRGEACATRTTGGHCAKVARAGWG